MTDRVRQGIIYGFPVLDTSYTESLYEAVRKRGVEVREGVWAGRWLLANLRRGDTVHLHWPSFHYHDQASYARSVVLLAKFVVFSLFLRLRGVRFVWTAHNLYPHDGGRSLWMHRFARRFVVRIVDRVYVHGPAAASIVRREFAIDRAFIRIIQHGNWIDTYPNSISQEDARKQLGLSAADHIYLFIGACKPYKGLEELIDTVKSLPDGTLLVIAGKFPSREYQRVITELADRAGTDRVSIHPGFIDDDRIQDFLNASDTVVLPYREILTSGAAMLAMSFGRPVVAPGMGCLLDVVNEQCGVLYDPDAPSALGQAMLDASNRRFSAEAIREHAALFTWDAAADALVEEHNGYDAAHRLSYLKTTYAALAGVFILLALRFVVLPPMLHASIVRVSMLVLWPALFICVIAYLGGLVVLVRDTRERRHLPDLFYKYRALLPRGWNRGWRRLIRPLLGSALRPGDMVRVRSAAEIIGTLDDEGKLDNLPFMPEMLAYQDRELTVHRRIDKINDWIADNEIRRTRNIVTLVDARCNGEAHGGCQAACHILWHERWLQRVPASCGRSVAGTVDGSGPEVLRRLEALLLAAVSQPLSTQEGAATKYMCQITELLQVSTPMSAYDLRQDLRPLLGGNLPVRAWAVAILTILFNKLQGLRHGVEYPVTAPQLEHAPTPVLNLDLQPGELVRVRDKRAIGMTLYRNHNRGIWFGKELVRFCNQEYAVRSRVGRIINERTGEMMTLGTPCVILESVCGSGEFLRFCPQNEYAFWREIWLERVRSG